MKGGIIIFSRMNSSRLPGKALMELGGMPLIERVYRRALLTGYPVYLATSNEQDDDILVSWANKLNVRVFRGSKNNVLERGIMTAEHFGLSYFARLCGDRPLFNVSEMKEALDMMMLTQHNKLAPDLISNHLYGQHVPGLMTEIISVKALVEILQNQTISEYVKEHLTAYIYLNPEKFRILSMVKSTTKRRLPGYAIDTKDDFICVSKGFKKNANVGILIDDFDALYTDQEIPNNHERLS